MACTDASLLLSNAVLRKHPLSLWHSSNMDIHINQSKLRCGCLLTRHGLEVDGSQRPCSGERQLIDEGTSGVRHSRSQCICSPSAHEESQRYSQREAQAQRGCGHIREPQQLQAHDFSSVLGRAQPRCSCGEASMQPSRKKSRPGPIEPCASPSIAEQCQSDRCRSIER